MLPKKAQKSFSGLHGAYFAMFLARFCAKTAVSRSPISKRSMLVRIEDRPTGSLPVSIATPSWLHIASLRLISAHARTVIRDYRAKEAFRHGVVNMLPKLRERV